MLVRVLGGCVCYVRSQRALGACGVGREARGWRIFLPHLPVPTPVPILACIRRKTNRHRTDRDGGISEGGMLPVTPVAHCDP